MITSKLFAALMCTTSAVTASPVIASNPVFPSNSSGEFDEIETSRGFGAPAIRLAQELPQQDNVEQSDEEALVDVDGSELDDEVVRALIEEGKRELVVTGTRLDTPDLSVNGEVFTAEDIRESGATTVEQFLRTVGANRNSVGLGVNNRQIRNGRESVQFEDGGSLGGLGVAAADLRGLGPGNTLILVNGRRIAGAAGFEDGFVNLNNIPLAAVERIEVQYGGASAAYGSDAIGGVINFILKSNYNGQSVNLRADKSSTGADVLFGSYTNARAWDSGSLTATVSFRRTEPVQNAKTGYVTNDYRSVFASQQALLDSIGRSNYATTGADQRFPDDGGQPAILRLTREDPDPDSFGGPIPFFAYLPAGIDPATATFADFIEFDSNAPVVSNIPFEDGPTSEQYGLALNFQQDITNKFSVTLDVLGSYDVSSLRDVREAIRVDGIPFSQAYNPINPDDLPFDDFLFGPQPISAFYFPGREFENGSLEPGSNRTKSLSYTGTLGLEYEWDEDTRLRFNVTYSDSSVTGETLGIVNLTTQDFFGDCVFDPINVEISGFDIENADEIVAAQCAAITSSDPNAAFNFLNDGTGTLGAPASVFNVRQFQLDNSSSSAFFDAFFSSDLFSVPAGKVMFVVGGEYRSETFENETVLAQNQVPTTTDIFAGFTELRVPIFGGDFTAPLMKSLELTFQARYDRYDTTGPIGTVDNIPVLDGGVPIVGNASFDRISPRIGLAWNPVPTLRIRANWAQSFTPPTFSSLFDVNAGLVERNTFVFDPIDPDENFFVVADLSVLANPDLEPQIGESLGLGFNWMPRGFLSGLMLDVSYDRTDISNRIGSTDDLQRLLPRDVYYNIPELFVRDQDGRLLEQIITPINVGEVKSEILQVRSSYEIGTSFGFITPEIRYVNNLSLERSFDGNLSRFDEIGVAQGLDDYRIDASLRFVSGDFTAFLTGRYIPDHINDYDVFAADGEFQDNDFDGQGDQGFPVDDFLTFDLNVSYAFDNGMVLSAGGTNILDATPPFSLVDRRPYDGTRYDIRGRVLYLDFRYEF